MTLGLDPGRFAGHADVERAALKGIEGLSKRVPVFPSHIHFTSTAALMCLQLAFEIESSSVGVSSGFGKYRMGILVKGGFMPNG